MITAKLKPELENRLSILSKETGRTKTYYLQAALERYLEDMEDIYQADQILENPGKKYTLTEILAERGKTLKDLEKIDVADPLEAKAKKQLQKLPLVIQDRIAATLYQKIACQQNPRIYGKPLTGHLARYWRYRIGDYRIICQIEDVNVRILVIHIGHRRDIYQNF